MQLIEEKQKLVGLALTKEEFEQEVKKIFPMEFDDFSLCDSKGNKDSFGKASYIKFIKTVPHHSLELLVSKVNAEPVGAIILGSNKEIKEKYNIAIEDIKINWFHQDSTNETVYIATMVIMEVTTTDLEDKKDDKNG